MESTYYSFKLEWIKMYSIEVKNLKFGYKKNLVLKDLSFDIKKGMFLSIVGPNGSGKSTILKLLNNIYYTKSASISIEGKDINSFKKKDLARKMALVPQDTIINYEFTVEEVVLMGRHPYKGRFEREDTNDFEIVEDALKLTDTLYLKNRMITEISGGERQRVLIARAIAQEPSIILLDEPTAHLDINHQVEILNLLQRLNKEKGTTIVLVIHDINLGIRYSDEIIMLNKGEILGRGRPEKVITKDNIALAYNLKVAIDRNKHTNKIYLTPVG